MFMSKRVVNLMIQIYFVNNKGINTVIVSSKGILVKTSNKYLVIIGILSAWILYYNQQYLVGLTILSVLIGILYVISHTNTVNSSVNISKVSENSESLEWFNTLLQRWWLFSISGTENYFRNKINKIIQLNTPDFLEFIKVDRIIFGNSTPYASGIKFSDLTLPTGPPIYLTEKSLMKLIKFVKDARFYSVLLEFDVNFHLKGTEVHLLCKHKKFSDESKIILKDFIISGLVNLKLTLDTAVAFPHISQVSMYFNERKSPKLDYNILLNNVSNLMDRFKFWITFIIHSNIIKQKFKFTNFGLMEKTSYFLSDQQCLFGVSAIGVLIVRIININQSSDLKNNFTKINLCTVCMGNQTIEFRNTFQTDSLFSVVLLVQNILEEYVTVKLKSQNAIGIQTLATFTLQLKDYPLEILDGLNISKNDNQIDATMKLEYVKLDPIMREKESDYFDSSNDSGILHIDIIAAQNLLNNTYNNTVDSYCVLFANQHKVASSKVIKESRYPKWNESVEFFIYSLSKVSLMFVVYNEKKLNEDGLHEVIGISLCPINNIRKNLINYSSSLTPICISNSSEKAVGTIVFNVIFLPVEAVKYASNIVIGKLDDNTNEKDNDNGEENGQSEKPVLRLEVKGAKNLSKMDLIGSSDPYFKIKRNGAEIYKSKYIKNTLAPQWNEKVNIAEFEFQDILKIELYDRDVIKKDDFMGQLVLDTKILHDLSMLNESKWFHLENAVDGDILLEAKFSRQDEICLTLDCHDHHDSKTLILENDIGNSESDTFPSSVPSTERDQTRSKRLFGEVYSVVLLNANISNNEQLILKASIKKLVLPSKGKNIIKAYSTSQFQKTIFFSNYAFAIMYSPSKEHLKLKFTLIQKKTKKKIDELFIEIKKFANLIRSSECQLRMVRGSVILLHGKDKED